MICIGIILVKEKQWGNILLNFAAGLVGIAVAVLPVCLYFYEYNALDDMLYATFLHNLIYAKESTHESIFSRHFAKFVLLYSTGFFAVVTFAKKAKAENKRLYLSLAATSVVTYAMLIYSNVYEHYFTLGIPVFAIAVVCAFPDYKVKNIKTLFKREKFKSIALATIVCSFALMSIYSAGAPLYKTYISGSANEQYAIINDSMKVVPDEERDSVIGYNVPPDFYVHAGVTPCYKYYTLQKWMTTDIRDVNGECIEYMANEHPLWIITTSDEQDDNVISVLVDYTLAASDDNYNYYRYKE